jgi:hypothetical protein
LSEQFKNPIKRIIERCKIGTSSTHLYDRFLSWLGTRTSTKSDKVKQKVHSPAIKEHAFKALVRPKLEYRITIWDPHTQQQKLPIEQIQRRAARYVSNRYHNTSSVTDMMSDLNWAPLEVRRIRYTHIILQSYTPLSCHTIFKPINSSWHQIQTHKSKFIQAHIDIKRLLQILIVILPQVYHTLELTAYNIYHCRHSWRCQEHDPSICLDSNFHTIITHGSYQMYIVLTFDSLCIVYMLTLCIN